MKAYIIKLDFVDSDPLIWRRVILPAGGTFKRLHQTIQAVTNFNSMLDDYHFYEFDLVKQENLNITNNEYDEGDYKIRQPQTVKIDPYLEKYKRLKYIYDLGDNWVIDIKLEQVIDDYFFGYPTLLDGKEAAPPEDVGGSGGYNYFLKVFYDENHIEHEQLVEWAKMQGYRPFDKVYINEMIKYVQYKKTEWNKINHENYRVIQDEYRD